MLFNIEVDEGKRIVGYVVPDSFTDSASIRVTDGKRDLMVLPCREERSALVAAGRHATGVCGFTIDETMIADLSQQETLELYDQRTDILIYRRLPAAGVIQKRIFRLETHLVPLWRLDDTLDLHFKCFYKGIERHGLETATQIFLLSNASSMYLSGRLLFKSYEYLFNEAFNCIVMLRDPYMELAERLLTLKLVRNLASKVELLGARDMIAFGPAIDFAESIEKDEKALHRAFAKMPAAVIGILRNPLTRQLAARNADETPTRGAIAAALETLSKFSIVGLREHQNLFLGQLADLAGTSPHTMPDLPDFGKTAELCGRLRGIPEARVLLEQDLEVYLHVKSAVEKALTD
jgi:hypothetical protein